MGSFLSIIFFMEVFLTFQENFVPLLLNNTSFFYTNWLLSVDLFPTINMLGQILYSYYFFYFLIAGIILLVAMVGAIVLTLNFKQKAKHQFVLGSF